MACAEQFRPCRVLSTSAVCAAIGAVGAAALYYGIFFVMALANYFDFLYKHATFYELYPTALSYLIAFFTGGTLKHLPGYEIEWNIGLPLAFFCGMTLLGLVLALAARRTGFVITDDRIVGRAAFAKRLDLPLAQVCDARPCLAHGILLETPDGRFVFPLVHRRRDALRALYAKAAA